MLFRSPHYSLYTDSLEPLHSLITASTQPHYSLYTYSLYTDLSQSTEKERKRERVKESEEGERQRDRETGRQRDRETERQGDRETEKQRQTHGLATIDQIQLSKHNTEKQT